MLRTSTISDLELEFFDSAGKDSLDLFLEDMVASYRSFALKPGHRVTANIATHPQRFNKLLITLKSIEGQFDEVRIYLNNFTSVPDELAGYSTYLGPDITDNAKFVWCSEPGEYYFTLDDDIIYPPDYVSRTLPLIGDRVVSYHGRRLYGKGQRYYDNHRLWYFQDGLAQERSLDVAGTGVMAFDTDVFQPSLWRTPNYRMTDLLISLEVHMYGLDLVCLAREKGWLDAYADDFDGIYWEERQNDEVQRRLSDMILSYRGTDIETEINDDFDADSLSSISDFVGSRDVRRFVLLRFGNGHIADSMPIDVIALDTEVDRVAACSALASDVSYQYVRDFRDFEYCNGDFVMLDDRFLPERISTEVFGRVPAGAIFLCVNFVDGFFPSDKIAMCTKSGKEVTFYVYVK